MSGIAAKRKQLKLKAVAPKQKLFRANEPLLSVFMWGINHTVSCFTYFFVFFLARPLQSTVCFAERISKSDFNRIMYSTLDQLGRSRPVCVHNSLGLGVVATGVAGTLPTVIGIILLLL